MPTTRPSPGDIGDFLDLPGSPGLNRPGNQLPGNRPNIERPGSTRPNVRPDVNRPAVNRPEINRPSLNQTDVRNRIQGGNNVNIGKIDVNVRNNNINSVRNRWTNVNNRPFDRNFWVNPGFNRPPAYWRWQGGWGRYPRHWCWRPCTWAAYGTWFAWSWPQPIQYSYGTNIVYRNNYVYVNEEQVATTQEYYTQASEIAESIPETVEPEKVEWMPLGVFAITDAEGNDTNMLLQLAVSKEGIVAGTFWNDTTDKGRPVEGAVDRESQRAAWQFADNEDESLVMEAGIYDLTQDETPALIHFGQDSTQNWLLVRLPEPEDEE